MLLFKNVVAGVVQLGFELGFLVLEASDVCLAIAELLVNIIFNIDYLIELFDFCLQLKVDAHQVLDLALSLGESGLDFLALCLNLLHFGVEQLRLAPILGSQILCFLLDLIDVSGKIHAVSLLLTDLLLELISLLLNVSVDGKLIELSFDLGIPV